MLQKSKVRNQPTISLLGPHLNDLRLTSDEATGSRISHEPLLEGFQQPYHLSNSNTFSPKTRQEGVYVGSQGYVPRLVQANGSGQILTNPEIDFFGTTEIPFG